MPQIDNKEAVGWDAALPLERARLVRLCTQLTGNAQIAEDLVQETLLEAWRHAHKLRNQPGLAPWLTAIARNVCLRWVRSQGRERAHRVHPDGDMTFDAPNLGEWLTDDVDLQLELERDELAHLLDRALALLPPETRAVLVARYVEDSPHAEIAARLGLTADVVSMRLSRGKLLLRRALTTDLHAEATAYGFCDPATDGWQQTRVSCPQCGEHRLTMRFPGPPGTVSFRCPACHADPAMTGSDYRLTNAHFARLIGALAHPRTILKRTSAWAHDYFTPAIEARAAVCTNCGRPAQVRLSPHEDTAALVTDPHLVYVHCEACGEETSTSFGGLVATLPEVQRFWAEHRRMRTVLPEHEIDVAGQPALVTRLESLTNAARLDVMSRRDTLTVIGIHGAPASARGR
jgi:RNA polymerase sigma factor (sigma-70 family)